MLILRPEQIALLRQGLPVVPANWGIAASVLGSVVSGAMSKGSADSAASTQGAATEKAIEETKRQYDQTRTDLAPYRDAGSAALSRLRGLLGLGDPSTAPPGSDPAKYGSDANYRKAFDAFNQAHIAQYGIPVPASADPAVIADRLQNWYGYTPSDTPSGGPGSDSPLLRKFSQADLAADVPYNTSLQFGLDEGEKAINRRAAAGGGSDSGSTYKAISRFASDYGGTKAGDAYARFTGDQDRTFGKLSGVAGMGSGATTVGVGAGTAASSNLANLYTGQGNAAAAAGIAGGNALSGGVNNAVSNYGQYNLLKGLTGGTARANQGLSDLMDVGP